MRTLCRALSVHGVLSAMRPADGLDLNVHLTPCDCSADEGYAFDRCEMILERSGITQVFEVADAAATTLLDHADPRRQAGPETAARLIVAHLAVVLRGVMNSSVQTLRQTVSV